MAGSNLIWTYTEHYAKQKLEESYVVMGAVLRCEHGERASFLIPDASAITYASNNDLLLIPETATKPDINVINFGICKSEGCNEPCTAKMDLADKWEGCISATESDGVKVLVDGAELDCYGGSGIIEILDNGQNSSIEDVLEFIGDKDLTNQVRQSVLKVNLYRNKEDLMYTLGLESDEDFERYVQRKLDMIPLFPSYYKEYLKLIRDDEYGGLFIGTRENPLYEFMFLMDDLMVAHFTLEERQDILHRIMDGESTYKLEKEYGKFVDLHLAFVAIFNFGGRNEMMQAIIQQDMANINQNFQQIMGLFIYGSILGINDGSGPPSMDYYDHSGSWNNGMCFTKGTRVAVRNGYKKIEEIQVGNWVLSQDIGYKDIRYKKVTRTFKNWTRTLIKILIGNEEIFTTENHLFFVLQNGWVTAKHLKGGMAFRNAGGESLTIKSIERIESTDAVCVYNFEVEDWHNYFITTENILVHNDCSTGAQKWAQGSYGSPEESLQAHYNKHKDEVGAKDAEQYLRKAEDFAKNLRGATKKSVPGYTDGVTRYYKNGKYIDLDPDGNIISFGRK